MSELEREFLSEIESLAGRDLNRALFRIVEHFRANSGTIHLLGPDGVLHLKAATAGIPPSVLETVRRVPVGKGMAGLAVERNQPITACNIQTDTSGDVRPGAKATGLQGSIVVPILRGDAAVGALGVANYQERTFSEPEIESLLSVGRLLAKAA
jgi:signal transduction protein with GAF and PtsI domain